MKLRNTLKATVAFTGLLALVCPMSSAFALTVTSPGMALMIDGNDSNATVNISAADLTFPVGKYDFGFVSGSTYTMITSSTGSYSFTGGMLVDFAIRDKATSTVYSMSNLNNYATQIYTLAVSPSFSQHPVVATTYYQALALTWDLNKDGVADAGIDIAIATPLSSNDGMAPVAPVPVPAAAWLLGSGVAGLFGWAARRRRSAATAV